jgi:hypothetical protein
MYLQVVLGRFSRKNDMHLIRRTINDSRLAHAKLPNKTGMYKETNWLQKCDRPIKDWDDPSRGQGAHVCGSRQAPLRLCCPVGAIHELPLRPAQAVHGMTISKKRDQPRFERPHKARSHVPNSERCHMLLLASMMLAHLWRASQAVVEGVDGARLSVFDFGF